MIAHFHTTFLERIRGLNLYSLASKADVSLTQ